MSTGKNKVKYLSVFRRVVQLVAFLFFPGLFIFTFSAVGAVYKAAISGSFSVAELAQPLLVLLAVMPVTAIFGRFFCGFLCAFGAMGDLVWAISRKLFKSRVRISEKTDSMLKFVKYVVLLLVAIPVWTLSMDIESTMNPWTIFGMYASVSGWPALSYLFSVGGLLLLLIIVGSVLVERFFCRYLCPLGAIFAIVSRLRVFRLKKPSVGCGTCKSCSKKCSMGIPLYGQDSVSSGECIDCFECMDVCPRNNISAPLAPFAATIVSVALITGIYFAGELLPQSGGETVNTAAIVSALGAEAQGQYADGVYTGSASGYKGETEVQVAVENGIIADITVLSTDDDMEFFNRVEGSVISEIISEQSTEVNTVSGATFSSNAIIGAVADALEIEFVNSNDTAVREHGGGKGK